MSDYHSRRTFVASIGAVGAAALAGCGGGGGGGGGDGDGGGTTADGGNGGGDGGTVVAVGPNQRLVFEPETVTISTGDTVTWEFKSAGHNVCAYPKMHEKVSIPDGAEGFGTMEQGGNRFATLPAGETYQHTFETAGEYTYVCVPHAAAGMVGTVVVE